MPRDHRAENLQRRYGLTPADVDRQLAIQDHACAICRKPFTSSRSVHVDHDHDAGHLRGLLCPNCNLGLGQFFDDPDLLISARDYLFKSVIEQLPSGVSLSHATRYIEQRNTTRQEAQIANHLP